MAQAPTRGDAEPRPVRTRTPPQRSRLAIPLGNVTAQTGVGPISATLQTPSQVAKVRHQIGFVVFHRHAVDTRRFVTFELAKGVPQQLDVEQVVEVVEHLVGLLASSLGDVVQPS